MNSAMSESTLDLGGTSLTSKGRNHEDARKIRIVDTLFGRAHPQASILHTIAFTSMSMLRMIADKMFDDQAELKFVDSVFGGDEKVELPPTKREQPADPDKVLSIKYLPHIHTLLLAMMLKLAPPSTNTDDSVETASNATDNSEESFETFYLDADSWTAVSGMTNEYTVDRSYYADRSHGGVFSCAADRSHLTADNACPGFWERLFGSGRSAASSQASWWEFPAPELKPKESFDYRVLMNLDSLQVVEGPEELRGAYDRAGDDLLRFVKQSSGDNVSHEIRPSVHEGKEVWAIARHVSEDRDSTSRDVLYVAEFESAIPPKYGWTNVSNSSQLSPNPVLRFVVVL